MKRFLKQKNSVLFASKVIQKKLSLVEKKCAMFCNNMLQKEQESDISLFITHVQACVATIRLLEIAWILTSDCIKLGGNHAISGSYVTRCKRSPPWVGKTRNTYRLYCKKELLNTHYFRGKKPNTAIELVLQHLMLKNKLHVLPYLICVDQIRMNSLVSIL